MIEPLVYKSAAQPAPKPATQPAVVPNPAANSNANPPAAKKKPGLFTNIGKFFRHIFGAE
jgi:hypothetical protein